MYKRLFIFIMAFMAASCVPKLATQPEKPSTVDLGRQATVAFITTSLGEEERVYPYCTGVWVNRTVLITALHCARGGAKIEEIRKLPLEMRSLGSLMIEEIKDPTGFVMNYSIEGEITELDAPPTHTHASVVAAIDPAHDLAILKAVDDGNIPHHTWLKVAEYMPKVNDHLYVIGHPGGLYFTVMDGRIAAIRNSFPGFKDDEMTGPYLQVYSSIYKGNSGGPVISDDGQLLGIVSFIGRSPNQGFVIAPPPIRDLIARAYKEHLI